jgi:hypothetical protein
MKKTKKRKTKKQISKKETKEPSELEEEIEELEEKIKKLDEKKKEIVKEEEFQSFMKPVIESFSPVLEPANIAPQESLERNISSIPMILKEDEKEVKYESGYNKLKQDYGDSKKPEDLNNPMQIIEPQVKLNQEQNLSINPGLERENQGNLEKDYIIPVEEFKPTKTRSPIEQQEKNYDFR